MPVGCGSLLKSPMTTEYRHSISARYLLQTIPIAQLLLFLHVRTFRTNLQFREEFKMKAVGYIRVSSEMQVKTEHTVSMLSALSLWTTFEPKGGSCVNSFAMPGSPDAL